MGKRSKSAEADARWQEFWRDHRDFESPWARGVLVNLVEFLPYVFDFDAVKEAVVLMYRRSGIEPFPDGIHETGLDWPGEVADEFPASVLMSLPIFQLALEIRAYAYYGLDSAGELAPNAGVSEFLELHEMKSFPVEFGRDKEMDQAIRAAFARRKLDGPERGGLTPEELAALARVSRKSIMNLLAPKSRGPLRTTPDGTITVDSARSWLLSRPDFRPSIRPGRHRVSSSPSKLDAAVLEEPVFVPVAGDGSWFSPGDCYIPKGKEALLYHVANGGHEESFEEYWPALEFLSRAESPRWRYLDAIGRWRIKNAVGWERKTRQEIARMLAGGADDRQVEPARRKA